MMAYGEQKDILSEKKRVACLAAVLLLGAAACGANSSPSPQVAAICVPNSAVANRLSSQQHAGDAPSVKEASQQVSVLAGPAGAGLENPETLQLTDASGNVVRTITISNSLQKQAADLQTKYDKSHADNSLALSSVGNELSWTLVYIPPGYNLDFTCPAASSPLYSAPSATPSKS